jgi:hypothetical protein
MENERMSGILGKWGPKNLGYGDYNYSAITVVLR